MKVVGRTVTVRHRTGPYGGAELKIVGSVRSRNNYFHLYVFICMFSQMKYLTFGGHGEIAQEE